jgi:hypothetical protein
MKAPGRNAGSGSISRLAPQFADRRPRIWLLRRSNFQPRTSNFQNSNREKEACFSEKDRQGQSEEKSKAAPTSCAGAPAPAVAGGLTSALPYKKRPGQLQSTGGLKAQAPSKIRAPPAGWLSSAS